MTYFGLYRALHSDAFCSFSFQSAVWCEIFIFLFKNLIKLIKKNKWQRRCFFNFCSLIDVIWPLPCRTQWCIFVILIPVCCLVWNFYISFQKSDQTNQKEWMAKTLFFHLLLTNWRILASAMHNTMIHFCHFYSSLLFGVKFLYIFSKIWSNWLKRMNG